MVFMGVHTYYESCYGDSRLIYAMCSVIGLTELKIGINMYGSV